MICCFVSMKKYENLAASKGISLQFSLVGVRLTVTARWIRSASHRFCPILMDNALSYTPQGGKILLLLSQSAHHTIFAVADDGSSIPEEEKAHIFERFYREDRSRSKETGGYGLGLAIAKQIVEEHKGQISVRDLQPKGVIFQIRLPKVG